MNYKLLLFDLDGTLLRSDKTISDTTLDVLQKCREKGFLIGISTSRSEKNCLLFLKELKPDVIISSGGALLKYHESYIHKAEFSVEETGRMIMLAKEICGVDVEITIDTLKQHYWNYKIDPSELDDSWGESIYTDFTDFRECGLKMCVEIFDEAQAEQLAESLPDCDCVKFIDGDWYKFTKKTATKETAIKTLCEKCDISVDKIIAFGDDLVDIGMLKLCGRGIAMGNALEEVKQAADVVIGSNDEDGIAGYLRREFLSNYRIQEYEKYNEKEIFQIYEKVGWTNYTSNPEMLKKAYENSLKIYGAYEGEKLIGIVRVVGDGYSIIYIQDIIVLPEYQRQGIGKRLLEKVLETYKHVYQKTLLTDNTEKTIHFYKSVGFMLDTDIECRAFLKVY